MIKISNKKKGLVYLLLAIVFIIPLLLEQIDFEQDFVKSDSNEEFDSKIATINSIEKALIYIDSVVLINEETNFDTLLYVQTASSFTKRKFFHGLAKYKFSENWIAVIGANCFWSHLSAIVDPDDIIKHTEALCSQQSIVFMEILKRRGIKSRSVGLGYQEGPGHFLTEVFYEGQWHLYDVNKEPKWSKIKNHHMSMDYYISNKDTLFVVYEDQMEKDLYNKIMERVQFGTPDKFPAKKMFLFHKITGAITYILPIFFFVSALYIFYKNERPKRKEKISEQDVSWEKKSVI